MSKRIAAILVLTAFATAVCTECGGFLEEPMVPLVGQHGTNFDPAHIHAAPPEMRLGLRVYLEFYDKEGMETLKRNMANPRSPDYHRLISHNELLARFSPRKSDVDAVAKWLESNGLTVTEKKPDDLYIAFSGTVAQIERAFRVKMVSNDSGSFFTNTTDPLIPARFQGIIKSITLGTVGGMSGAQSRSKTTDRSYARGGRPTAVTVAGSLI